MFRKRNLFLCSKIDFDPEAENIALFLYSKNMSPSHMFSSLGRLNFSTKNTMRYTYFTFVNTYFRTFFHSRYIFSKFRKLKFNSRFTGIALNNRYDFHNQAKEFDLKDVQFLVISEKKSAVTHRYWWQEI